jgi:N-acetyl-gamma-glutamyl-phosphate reductase
MYTHAPVTTKVRAAVAGANGYAGMTAVHLLSRHPNVELVQLTSRSHAGKPYSEVFPLLGLTGEFVAEPTRDGLDVIFSCLPHNVGASKVGAWLDAGIRVIDMSADFRLRDASLYPMWYRQPHPAPRLLEKAVFGLPELHADELESAELVAVPGCFSTAAIIALAPAEAAGLIGTEVISDVIVDAKSGVSGAGRSPGMGVHFSEVNESLHAYAVEGHRHKPEILQELGERIRVTFVPHLVPMTRGILATCYFDLLGTSVEQARDAYREFYVGQPFTRIVDTTPSTKQASHSNLCLVNVANQGTKAVVTAALDNLVKGASGQGVECFNIAFGFPRTTALEGPVQWP